MNQQDRFDGVLASLREAALDDAHWGVTSGLIDELCGLKGNYLGLGKQDPDGRTQVLLARFFHRGQRRQDWEQRYFQVYQPHDERLPRLRRLPDGQVVHVKELYTQKEMKDSPAYNEALAIAESQNGLNVRLDGPDGANVIWVTADPVAAGGWSTAQVNMIERLLPHICHFVRVRQALADAKVLGVPLANLLDTIRIGVIFLDRRGRILRTNDRTHADCAQVHTAAGGAVSWPDDVPLAIIWPPRCFGNVVMVDNRHFYSPISPYLAD